MASKKGILAALAATGGAIFLWRRKKRAGRDEAPLDDDATAAAEPVTEPAPDTTE